MFKVIFLLMVGLVGLIKATGLQTGPGPEMDRQTLLAINNGHRQIAVYVDGFRAATLMSGEAKCIELHAGVRSLQYQPLAGERLTVLAERLDGNAWEWEYVGVETADAISIQPRRQHCK